jgi:histone H3/H4
MTLIVKSNIKKVVNELQRTRGSQSSVSVSGSERDKEIKITSVAEEVGMALERRAEELLAEGIKRAKLNGRRTLQARDL